MNKYKINIIYNDKGTSINNIINEIIDELVKEK
jgi:hypothetical protein